MKEIEREIEDLSKLDEDHGLTIQHLKNEHVALKQDDEFAKDRIQEYRLAHKQLENDSDTLVATFDFTANQTSMEDKFVDFVIIVATQKPITISESLTDSRIFPIQPPSIRGLPVDLPQQANKKRRTSGQAPSRSPNLRDDIKHNKRPKLDQLAHPPPEWKPTLLMIHFMVQRSKEANVKQTLDYVQWALEYLEDHGLFSELRNIKIWSDGCGKHFKTYNTHFFISHFQEKLGRKATWDFLAPNRAHNRCDAAAGHIKVALNKYIRNFYILSDVTHLAFACSKLVNTLMIEAKFSKFPQVEAAVPV